MDSFLSENIRKKGAEFSTDKERSRKIIKQEWKRECYTRLRRVVSPQKCVRPWELLCKSELLEILQRKLYISRGKLKTLGARDSLWHPLSPIRTDDPANNRFLPRVRQRGGGTPYAPYVFLKTMELNCRILLPQMERILQKGKRCFPLDESFRKQFPEKFSFFHFIFWWPILRNDGLKKKKGEKTV